ncbi:MAG: 2-C-methyl-D-erythritol 4-phosphate cytidylyltransferase, partial [Muribaculaceae bacterium]|nr:2-C-methyl-D-erythritol 4-phosphate cytidylyltransferase [Muribaculaceae bacterium]
ENGIMGIETENMAETFIAVHDAARPLVRASLISRGWRKGREEGAAIPVIPMTDSLRELTSDGSVALDRSRYVRVQTPQVFRGDWLKDAYSGLLRPEMTDDASVVEEAGVKVALYEGSETNIKVTNPLDFKIAELLMKENGKEISE